MDPRIVRKKLEILHSLSLLPAGTVDGWQYRISDNPAPGVYQYESDWAAATLPLQVAPGRTLWLRAHVDIPLDLPLADSYLDVAFGEMEGLLSLDGAPYAGIDDNHRRAPLPRHGAVEAQLEFLAMPSHFYTDATGRMGTFSGARLITVDRDIEALIYDVRFAWETAEVITDPRRKAALAAAVEVALLAVDLTLPRLRLRDEVAVARALLHDKVAAIHPDPEAGGLYAVGHTHIDTAWLWPLRETVRKCGRSFATACRLMERYPHFHFTCSQPQLYQYTKTYFPDLYREITRWVATGRWETAGAMWVEADCNISSGEALIRQMLYGIRFFQQEFGTRPRMVWLPDVFGYPASLPEIMAGCGINYFYTYKLHWQAQNTFPASLFRWRGLDGSEVMAHVVNHDWGYNNFLNPAQLVHGWERYAQKAAYPEVIFPFGYGDGGGGVNEEQMEMFARAAGRYPGLPAVRIGTAEHFFADITAAAPELPVWDGELYVETHRGTYTTQSAIKRANRRCELGLREAEIWGALACVTGATQDFTAATLRPAWEQVLLYQFHDILPGSSIGMVYAEALPELAAVETQARYSADAMRDALLPRTDGEAIIVGNTLSWPRRDLVEVVVSDNAVPTAVKAPDGAAYPTQVIARGEGTATLLFSAGEVSAVGYATYTPTSLADMPALVVTPHCLENRFFHIELNAEGGITRWYDRIHQREVLAPDAVGNDLQLLQDGPEGEDAWNVHETNDKRRYPFEGETQITVQETGPLRGVVRVQRTHRASTVVQDIIIYAQQERVDFVTQVDWQERQTMLKVAFPVAIRSARATYEVQFGAYERPTHRNTSWEQQKFEVPAQRWVDLSEAGYGVSLLNDARYGCDVHEHVLRLTLLRSTIFPDPEADRGQHTFTYALLPHAGAWQEAEIPRRAWELNVPLRGFAGGLLPGAAPARSFVTLSGAPAIVEAIKPAEDGDGLILRLYEPYGGRGEVTVTLDFTVTRVTACNLVEEEEHEVPLVENTFRFTLTPFQIRSFRLRY